MKLPLWQRWLVPVLTLPATIATLTLLFSARPSGSWQVVLLLTLPPALFLTLPSYFRSLLQSTDSHVWLSQYWSETVLLLSGLLFLLVIPLAGAALLVLRQCLVSWRWWLPEPLTQKASDRWFRLFTGLFVGGFVWLAVLVSPAWTRLPQPLASLWPASGSLLGIGPQRWQWLGALVFSLFALAWLWKSLDTLLEMMDAQERRWWVLGSVALFALQPWFWKWAFAGNPQLLLTPLLISLVINERQFQDAPRPSWMWGGALFAGVLAILLPGGLWLLLCFGLWRAWWLRQHLFATMASQAASRRLFLHSGGALLLALLLPFAWERGMGVGSLTLPWDALDTLVREPEWWIRWLGSFLVQEMDGGSSWMFRCQLSGPVQSPCFSGGLPTGWWLFRAFHALLLLFALWMLFGVRRAISSRSWSLWVLLLLVGLLSPALTQQQSFASATAVFMVLLLLLPALAWTTLSPAARKVAVFLLLAFVLTRFPGQAASAKQLRWSHISQTRRTDALKKMLLKRFPNGKKLILHNLPLSPMSTTFAWLQLKPPTLPLSRELVTRWLQENLGRLQPSDRSAQQLKRLDLQAAIWLVEYKGPLLRHRWQWKSSGLSSRDYQLYRRWTGQLNLLERVLLPNGEQWLLFHKKANTTSSHSSKR